MLSDVKFCELDKDSFDAQIKPLRAALSVTQQKIKRAKIPVIIVFEGWGAAGKGSDPELRSPGLQGVHR